MVKTISFVSGSINFMAAQLACLAAAGDVDLANLTEINGVSGPDFEAARLRAMDLRAKSAAFNAPPAGQTRWRQQAGGSQIVDPNCIAANFSRNDSIAALELKAVNGPPAGNLLPIGDTELRAPGDGALFKDGAGTLWLVRDDAHDIELRTGARVVSAWIYRHFGYLAPETYVVNINERRCSASRLLPSGDDTCEVNRLPDTAQFRAMRIIAAFLRDWGRLQQSSLTRRFSDGSFALSGLDDTLGMAPGVEVKAGGESDGAVGTYRAPLPSYAYVRHLALPGDNLWYHEHPMKQLYDSYDVGMLPKGHPWRRMTVDDARQLVEKFRTLDIVKITEIVNRAEYTSSADRLKMIDSLRIRRNAFLEYLLTYLGDKETPAKWSYWASQHPLPDLSFEVRDNRPARIGSDVRDFLSGYDVPSGHMVLFRGQETLTSTVLAPSERQDGIHTPLRDPDVQMAAFNNRLLTLQYTLNHRREEQHKFNFVGREVDTDTQWWERATAMDALAFQHSVSNGENFLVSATRSLGVASRWVETSRFSTKYRYVYILSVPEEKTVPITQSLASLHGAVDEDEVDIIFDATPYVIGVYDTVDGKFVQME